MVSPVLFQATVYRSSLRIARESLSSHLATLEGQVGERAFKYAYAGGTERGERNPALVNIGKIAAALKVSVAEFY